MLAHLDRTGRTEQFIQTGYAGRAMQPEPDVGRNRDLHHEAAKRDTGSV